MAFLCDPTSSDLEVDLVRDGFAVSSVFSVFTASAKDVQHLKRIESYAICYNEISKNDATKP